MWILEREPITPKTLRSHKTTTMITTTFRIDLMEPAMGIKRLISQRKTPTTIRTIITWTKGIFLYTSLFIIRVPCLHEDKVKKRDSQHHQSGRYRRIV
jgi:hypothetical protein